MTAILGVRPGQSLSARELQVLNALAGGMTYAEAASHLGITAATIGGHVRRIMVKLDACSTAHAVMIACDAGLIGVGAEREKRAAAALGALVDLQYAMARALDSAGVGR